MQELASAISEYDIDYDMGLEPMPDASLLTLATLIYCSLAIIGVLLRQQDEETDDLQKPTSNQSTSNPANNTGTPSPTSPMTNTSTALQQQYCQQISRDSRLRILTSNAAAHVTTSVRDAKYLLEQIMPERLHAACNGEARAESVQPPIPTMLSQACGRTAGESHLRSWLAGLVDSYVDAKQKGSGLTRETTARVVLNNQASTLRHLCTIVAQETALLGTLHLMHTLQADPAFNPQPAPTASASPRSNAAAH